MKLAFQMHRNGWPELSNLYTITQRCCETKQPSINLCVSYGSVGANRHDVVPTSQDSTARQAKQEEHPASIQVHTKSPVCEKRCQ